MVTGEGREKERVEENFNARFNLYSHMAHFVAEKLHMRPGEILDTWCTPELIVAYGYYLNEVTLENFSYWENGKKEGKMPKKYNVKFYTGEE